jgi:hypothetical protein
LVDYRKRFLDIEVGWPGSVGDARVFQNLYLGSHYEDVLREYTTMELPSGDTTVENIPAFILGDSAYPNTRHLVTTYKVTECDSDPSIRHLNHRLSKARYHVEHAFGLLKGRFQIFAKPLMCASEDFPFTVHLIGSIFVLHNFLIDSQDTLTDNDVLPPEIVEQLQGAELREGDMWDDIVEDDQGNERGMIVSQAPTRKALLRHIKWLDEDT